MNQATPRVLVVDDERIIASTYAIILKAAGFNAVPAYSGEEAIQVASFFAPNVLVSDIAMGGIDGVEAAQRIVTICPECKVLLVSGDASVLDVPAKARAKGFNFQALLKPVSPPELLGHISRLITWRVVAA